VVDVGYEQRRLRHPKYESWDPPPQPRNPRKTAANTDHRPPDQLNPRKSPSGTRPTPPPATTGDRPKPPYLRTIHCQFSPPAGSLQKSCTPIAAAARRSTRPPDRNPSTASSHARAGSRTRDTCRPWSRTSAPACAADAERPPGSEPVRSAAADPRTGQPSTPGPHSRQRERAPRKAPPQRTPRRQPKSRTRRYEHDRTATAEHDPVAQDCRDRGGSDVCPNDLA
jgi:hypothetical protein